MMKRTILYLLMTFFAIGTFAQAGGVAPLAKGDKQLNFGTGFSNNGIPIYVSMDFALHKDITLTPEVHVKFDDKVKGGILLKADYHWNYLIGIPDNWDFYAGVRAGFDVGDDDFVPDIGIQVGGRWYWSEKWGMNLELGGGTGFGTTFGLSMKL
jgi:outer membrane immunogenic protein